MLTKLAAHQIVVALKELELLMFYKKPLFLTWKHAPIVK